MSALQVNSASKVFALRAMLMPGQQEVVRLTPVPPAAVQRVAETEQAEASALLVVACKMAEAQ